MPNLFALITDAYDSAAHELPGWLPPWAVFLIVVPGGIWGALTLYARTKKEVKEVKEAFFGQAEDEVLARKQDMDAAHAATTAQNQEIQRLQQESAAREKAMLARLDAVLAAQVAQMGTLAPDAKAAFDKAAAETLRSGDSRAESALNQLASGDTDAGLDALTALAADRAKAAQQQIDAASAEYYRLAVLTTPFDPRRAKQAFEQAIALQPEKVSRRHDYANLLVRLGDTSEAEKNYRAVLDAGSATQDKELQTMAYGGLGLVAQSRGDTQEAIDAYSKARDFARERGDLATEAIAIGNLGNTELARGNLAAAEAHQTQALTLHTQSGNQHGQALALTNLGAIAGTRGDLAGSEAYMQRSLPLFAATNDRHGESVTRGNLAWLAVGRNDWDDAEAHATRALALAEELSGKDEQAFALNALGRVDRERGNLAAAREKHGRALTLYQEMGDKLDHAQTLTELGGVAIREKNFADAEELLRGAINELESLGAKPQLVSAYSALALLSEEAGRNEDAATNHRRVIALCDEMSIDSDEAKRSRAFVATLASPSS